MTDILAGQYRILERIALGGMGAVHRAEGCSGRLDGQPLVIKSLLTLRQSDASARHAFREEARILSMMSHENIVRVFDFLDAGDNLHLVMEFIAGDTLSHLNRRCAAADLLMPLPLVLRIGIDAARALHHAHMLVDPNGQHLRVVHRDVSPQNIMLDQSGQVKVLDFGIAQSVEHRYVTGVKRIKGKAPYLSPEQLRADGLDARSDQFSLGIVLFELLTNRHLFAREDLISTMKQIEALQIPQIHRLRPEVTSEISAVIQRALSREPDARYDSCMAFADALEEASPGALEGVITDDYAAWRSQLAGQTADLVKPPKLLPFNEGNERALIPRSQRQDVGERDLGQTAVDVTSPWAGEEQTLVDGQWPLMSGTDAGLDSAVGNFFGREEDLRAISRQLDRGTRLLSILGPGGVGKTRLSLEIASRVSRSQFGSVHFCDLSYARTADDIVTRVLQDLELVLIEGVAGDALALALSQRQNMLVVIDNVEQVAQPMKALLARWTAIAPQVTFLLTSRVRIGLKNEVLHRLDALPLTDAMSLFMARAQQAAPLATLDAELLQAYASLIAQKVDRLPLAIELAAARIRTHSLQDIHDQLDDRFSLLYDRDGQRPERQSSLYAAIEWSWDLLERATQETFLQLAVFKTSFTLTAARAVVGFDGDEAGAMGLPGHLSVLVEHSLVRKLGIVEGESRYGFLESIRHFAETKQNDKWPIARSRHLAYFAQRGTSDSLRALDFAGGHELVRRWRHDLDNYSAAASYGLSQGLYDDAASVALVYLTTCKFMHLPAVGLALLDDDITSLCSGDLRLKLGLLEAELSILMGDAARCHERLKAIMAEPLPADQEVLSLKAEFLALQQNVDQLEFGVRRERLLALEARAREIDAIVIECDARLFRAWNQTDMDQMLGECRAVEARCQAHRLEWLEVSCKNYIGMTLYRLGRYEEAAQTLQNVALTSQEYGMERWEIGAIGNLGSVFKEQGRYQDAQANYLKTLSLAEQYGSPRLTAVFLTNLSELARVRHDLRAARTYGVRAVQLATKLELAYLVAITTGNLGYVLALDGDVDEGVVKLQGAIEKMRMLAPHYAAVYEARLAHICASQNRMDDADTLLLKALECVDTASLNIETAEICLHFMHVSSAGGRWREFNGMRQCLASYFESRGSPSSGPLYEAYLVATRSFATHAGSDP